jgi:hypothetical protein
MDLGFSSVLEVFRGLESSVDLSEGLGISGD